MKNKNKLIFIIIIYGMLFLPSIIYPLVKNKMDLTNYENRTLSNLDDVVNADFVDFSTKFDDILPTSDILSIVSNKKMF